MPGGFGRYQLSGQKCKTGGSGGYERKRVKAIFDKHRLSFRLHWMQNRPAIPEEVEQVRYDKSLLLGVRRLHDQGRSGDE